MLAPTLSSFRRAVYPLVAAVFLFAAQSAFAAEIKPFDAQAFAADQKAGKTTVLQFHATWCPTCRAQKPVLEQLLTEPEFSAVGAYAVDYDNSDELQQKLSVRRQSTIIVYKGEVEAARSVGETSKDALAATLKKGL